MKDAHLSSIIADSLLERTEKKCNECQTVTKHDDLSFIESNPKLIIIHIRRYTFRKGKVLKIKSKVFLDEVHLSMNKQMYTYTPTSVVSHMGEDNKGHYVCYSKMEDGWTEFSDTIIRGKGCPLRMHT